MDCALLSNLLGREADVRDLRVGVRAPWHCQRARFPPSEEQRVLNDDAGGRIGDVGELQPGAHVACGVYAAIAGSQPVINNDSVRPDSNASG